MHQTRSSRADIPMRQQLPAGGNSQPTASESRSLSAGDTKLTEAVSRLNDYIQNINRNIEFTVDAEVNRVVVKVYNLETTEIIREIPAEEVLNMSQYVSRQKAWLSSMGL